LEAADSIGGFGMKFSDITKRAKEQIDKRGGVDALKQDAQELREIAKGPGTMGDKAKKAAAAVKEAGARDTTSDEASRAAAAGGQGPAPEAQRQAAAQEPAAPEAAPADRNAAAEADKPPTRTTPA
jgi:hypothetical protein